MSTLNPPKHISKRHELREDKVITFYARAWAYFDAHRMQVYGALAALVVLVLGVVGYVLYQNQQAAEAERLLGQIVGVYEQGTYQQALEGTPERPGLLTIADEYGGTEAGNLARFYAADAYYQLGEFDQALEYFQAFDPTEDFIGASAIAGEAAVYENQEAYEQAGDRYREAALFFENDLSSPRYLLNAGRAYELAGNLEAAREAYELIRTRFPESELASGVDFYLARVDAKAAS